MTLEAPPSPPALAPALVPADPAPAARALLGEMLVQAGKLNARDLERALCAQQEMHGLLGRVLVRLGVVSEMDVARTLAAQLGVPLASEGDFPDLPVEVAGLRSDFLQAHQLCPLRLESSSSSSS